MMGVSAPLPAPPYMMVESPDLACGAKERQWQGVEIAIGTLQAKDCRNGLLRHDYYNLQVRRDCRLRDVGGVPTYQISAKTINYRVRST